MNRQPNPLTETILQRLTGEALMTFLGTATGFEAAARPGLHLALCNEPVADMNMLVAGAGASERNFRDMTRSCLDRQIPFLVLIFPGADAALEATAAELGLTYAVDFPFMVRDEQPLQPGGNPAVEVTPAVGEAGAGASADIMVSAYSMPRDSVLRAIPAAFLDSPGADIYLARLDGATVGTVTLTYHGDTCGIWAMGTDTARQRGGIGKRLLSTAMAQAMDAGCKRFFLGATPAGYRLYEGLGFETVFAARVWVSGETHQA